MITELIARLTPPCTDITRLVSESMDRPMALSTRLSLRFHFLICAGCAAYKRQLEQIRQTLRRSANAAPGESNGSTGSSPETTARLKDAFRQQAKKP